MNILFLHRSFPAQFKYLANELAQNSSNRVIFITNSSLYEIENVEKIVYKTDCSRSSQNPLLKSYDSAVLHAKAAAKEAKKLKEQGFTPDIIYAHSGWGPAMFMKDIFPDSPLICYFEWFQNAQGADTGFDGTEITEIQKEGIRCSNSQVLVDLYSCDAGISPTQWQKQQFPKEFQDKIKVLHDGIDTDFFKPQEGVNFLIEEKKLKLTSKDEVITYATRGMEPYRGFPEFMKALEKLQKLRPNLQAVIAGEDKVFYREKLEKGTYKELMLKELDLDLDRIHFAGGLSYVDYLKLLQISSVHVYLTIPYVLSWSFLEAMSCGCCIVSSNTLPVLEVMKDNYNGLLSDFYNTNQLVEKINYALDNQDKMQEIRNNVRKTILEKYSLEKVLPQHIDFMKSFIHL